MKLYSDSTIVALSTPPGYGGIGVVRLSGEQAVCLTKKLLAPRNGISFVPNRVFFDHLIHPETKQVLDDVLISYFKAPHSYTGEDVVEISGHGSPVVLAEVLRLLISFGAVLAQPGEFTMRAFLNQRIDLTQAEAIHDLIFSQTKYQAQLAARQLHGELSKQIKPIKNTLVEMIVYFESSIEFVEDDLDSLNLDRFSKTINNLIEIINKLICSYRFGRLIRSGVKLALVGRPNVGKSSVFNRMLGRERAIVTSIPGTTRDSLSEAFSLNGIPIELVDTAGIRETDDLIEMIGVERTRSAIAEADFVIGVVEACHTPCPDEQSFFSQIPIQLLVINKCDLGDLWTDDVVQQVVGNKPVVRVSALTGDGIEQLRAKLHETFSSGEQGYSEGSIITNERHYAALEKTLDALHQAKHDLSSGLTEEFVLVHLHAALQSLGIITGETLIGDILNQIFSTFCIGK